MNIEVTIRGKRLCASKPDDIVVLTKDNYEHHIVTRLPELLARGGGFIDVGAHFGYYTLVVKDIKADVPIFNFDPNPRNYECILNTVGWNGFGSVMTYCCGASDVVRTLDYGDTGSDWFDNGTVMDLNGRSKQPVMVIPIDLTPATDTPICCMKIDVEGHELHGLRGAERLIRTQRPAVVLEFCPQALAQHGTRPLDLVQWMLDRGYGVEVLEYQPGMGKKFDTAEACVAHIASWPSWMTDLLFVHKG